MRHIGCDNIDDAFVASLVEANDNADQNSEEETARDEVNRRALENLSSWVPALGLYKLRRSGERYEAVPVWRASNSGTALENRKASLKIHPKCIRDMGSGEGFSLIGLVQQPLDVPDDKQCLDDAFRWLADQTGYPQNSKSSLSSFSMR